ncbi:glutamate mutase L [Salininema proteolyticum]|uniref:Glutamate mutase L n=1 Tax=Salininema proteolyticum TaxID=1607685 RepID=A0ABV8U1F4_9ACTN
MTSVLCLDVGSTYTKALHLDGETGEVLRHLSRPTTLATDIADGVEDLLDATGTNLAEAHACSSAGGGLRLAVVGNEPLVTARAAYQAGLSAGAKIVHIAAGGRPDPGALAAARPDLVLLAGGTDGGDEGMVLDHARALADIRLDVPVIYAGNENAAPEAERLLAGQRFSACANVLPRIGELNAGPARERLRQAFLDHVIGGKHLSAREDVIDLIGMPTPDAVLAGVEHLARHCGRDVLVVDVGGATTDVYSARTPDPESEHLYAEVGGTAWNSRTVEGDLGLRHNAHGIAEAAVEERLMDDAELARLRPALDHRTARPDWLADTGAERDLDLRLCTLAARIAVRRHARGERIGGPGQPVRGAKNLSSTGLLLASGGFFRAHPETTAASLAEAVLDDFAGGIRPPRDATVAVDAEYRLFAMGLLGKGAPRNVSNYLADRLASGLLPEGV